MEQRYGVLEVQAGVPVVDVARRFGVFRQAVHRWVNRYQSGGLEALADRSKRPRSSPWQIGAGLRRLSSRCAGCIRGGSAADPGRAGPRHRPQQTPTPNPRTPRAVHAPWPCLASASGSAEADRRLQPLRSASVRRVSPVARGLSGLLAADLISTIGTEMTAVALPWLVLVSTGSAARMGAVLAAEFLGIALLGLWGGRIATVLGARRMMLVSDLARACLVASVPVLALLGALPLAVIVTIAFLVGGFFPAYSSSQRLVLAEIAGDDELSLTRAGGVLNSVNETASFVGPALGGVLVVVIGAGAVLALDAASYLCAFLLVALLVPTSSEASHSADSDSGIVQGLRYLLGQRPLRRQMIGLALIQVGWTAMTATLRVMALYGGGAAAAGGLLASYGAGSVIGGLASARARTVGSAIAGWAVSGIAVTIGLLLVPAPLWVAMTIVAANGVCAGLFFPRFFAGLTARTPPALRSRVMTSVTIGIAAPAPLGFLGAGVLTQNANSAMPGLLLATGAAGAGAIIVLLGLTDPSAATS